MEERLLKKAEELMEIVKNDGSITMWELLAETSADGLSITDAYTLFMYLDKAWYDADHYWKGVDGELKKITPTKN